MAWCCRARLGRDRVSAQCDKQSCARADKQYNKLDTSELSESSSWVLRLLHSRPLLWVWRSLFRSAGVEADSLVLKPRPSFAHTACQPTISDLLHLPSTLLSHQRPRQSPLQHLLDAVMSADRPVVRPPLAALASCFSFAAVRILIRRPLQIRPGR